MKSDWGKKVECPMCGSIFYDMKKKDITCPSCDQKIKPSDFKKKRAIKNDDDEFERELKSDKDFDFTAETFDDSEDPSDEIEGIKIK